jgi:hypothetical protein
LELLEKRVKSRIGYNVINLDRPTFEDFKLWKMNDEFNESDLVIRYQMFGDSRCCFFQKDFETPQISFAELLVIVSILKGKGDDCDIFTPQLIYREYSSKIKPQLDALSLARPLSTGQFLRVNQDLK